MTGAVVTRFRTYDSKTSPAALLADLNAHPVPWIVLRREAGSRTCWHSLSVDEELLKRLDGKGTLEALLDLSDLTSRPPHVLPPRTNTADATRALAPTGGSVVLLGSDGSVRGVVVPPKPAAKGPVVKGLAPGLPKMAPPLAGAGGTLQEATLFPSVTMPDGNAVAPGETLQYVVRLSATPEAGVGGVIHAEFPLDAETLDLNAEVVSSEFTPAPGQRAYQKFTVSRSLEVKPPEWAFEVVAVGDRPSYSLKLVFEAAGAIAGAVVITAVRRGGQVIVPPRAAFGAMNLPRRMSAETVLWVTPGSGEHLQFILHKPRSGERVLLDGNWPVKAAAFFKVEEAPWGVDALLKRGELFRNDLPPAVVEVLDGVAEANASLLMLSRGREVPIESVLVRPAKERRLLGATTPVVRWADDHPTPTSPVIRVAKAACIRPAYAGEELAGAREEEESLGRRIPSVHIGNRAQFNTVMADPSIALVHFSGHAQDSPIALKLENAELLHPPDFLSDRVLLSEGRPFVFLNGCVAGLGTSTAPSAVNDLVRTLIKSGSRAVVAPFVRVDSQAARKAAETFYDASASDTIGEAVRKVRERALTTGSDVERLTYLSYAAFATPDQRLEGLRARE